MTEVDWATGSIYLRDPGVDRRHLILLSVTAARDPGRVTAILYSRLATSLRSLAIILPIHLHLLSLISTFAPVFL